MKVQNLAIIFLVIIIPLVLILSYYLNLQKKTLQLQTAYDVKLSSATKEAIKAFEVNTVDWSETEGRRKTSIKTRNEINAMINSFTTSLSNNLNVSGTAKEYMMNYIPAIAITMYDGYFIYAPEYVPVVAETDFGVQLYTDPTQGIDVAIPANEITEANKNQVEILYYAQEDGQTYYYEYVVDAGTGRTETKVYENLTTDINKAKNEYEHSLTNKMAYSGRYTKGANTNVIVNYTLDNKIYVYGEVNGENVDKTGYLVHFEDSEKDTIPRIKIKDNARRDTDIEIGVGVKQLIYGDTRIEPETLEEQILYKEGTEYKLGTFKYVYDITHTKLYYDEIADNFFELDKNKERQYIRNGNSVKIGDANCKYKSVSVLNGDEDATEYKKIYMALNGKDRGKWCISIKPENQNTDNPDKEIIDTEIKKIEQLRALEVTSSKYTPIYADYSAISYYVEACAFTNWVTQNLGGRLNEQKLKYELVGDNFQYVNNNIPCNGLFNISAENDLEDVNSYISEHKREIMKETINKNLNSAISNYSHNGKYNFKLPQLTDKDWEQVFSNISIITFFQGAKIGLKEYNSYAISTSTQNREYVDPNEIFFTLKGDQNYHKPYCSKCIQKSGTVDITKNPITGYRSVEYSLREYKGITNNGETDIEPIYYYTHANNSNTDSKTGCYYCIINEANFEKIEDNKENVYLNTKAYNEALARERYFQAKSLEGNIGIRIIYDPNKEVRGEITGIFNVPEEQEAELDIPTYISDKKPYITTNNQFIKFIFLGWSLEPDAINPDGTIRIDYKTGTVISVKEDMLTEEGYVKLYGVWRIALTNMNWTRDYKWTYPQEHWNSSGRSPEYIGDGSISNIRIIEQANVVNEENLNTIVEMVGNSEFSGKGAMWTEFTSDFLTLNSFTFNYRVNKGDSFNAAGFMFDVVDRGTYIEGYLLSINFTGRFLTLAQNNTGAIFRFTYRKNANTSNVESINLVATLPFGSYTSGRLSSGSGTLTIKVNPDGGYNISGTEMTNSIDIPPYNRAPNTFGFFSDHYDHACNEIGYFKIDNIIVTAIEKEI